MTIVSERIKDSFATYAYTKYQSFGDSEMTYRLRAEAHNQQVVIKIARVDNSFRLKNQAAIANEEKWLRKFYGHPGIIKIFAITEKRPISSVLGFFSGLFEAKRYRASLITWPGEPDFLVLQYIEGGTLFDFIETQKRKDKPITVKLTLQIILEIAETIAYLHAQGCIHRDLKAENILFFKRLSANSLTWSTRPILIDFGIAVTKDELVPVEGTLAWMSERLQRAFHNKEELPADPSWDMHALGLLLCYLLSGHKPTNQEFLKHSQITPDVLKRELPLPAEALQLIATALNQLRERALQCEPEKPFSAEEFTAEVTRILQMMDPSPFANFISPLKKVTSRRMVIMKTRQVSRFLNATWRKFLTLALALLCVGLGALLLRNPPPEPGSGSAAPAPPASQETTPTAPVLPPTATSAVAISTEAALLSTTVPLSITFTPALTQPLSIATTTLPALMTTTVATVALISPTINSPMPISPTLPPATATLPPAPTSTPTSASTATPTLIPTPTSSPLAIKPVMTASLSTSVNASLPTFTATTTPTATPISTTLASPTATLIPPAPSTPTSTPTPTPSPTVVARPTPNPQMVALDFPGVDTDNVKHVKDSDPPEKRIQEFKWKFNSTGACAELVFQYQLQNKESIIKLVKDVTNKTEDKVDLSDWFKDKGVSFGRVDFQWGVRVFNCGSKQRPKPEEYEWRKFTLTQSRD